MSNFDYESRHIIEALRSGIPSRAVGRYFSDARKEVMDKINQYITNLKETGKSSSFLFKGRYGEGKTHLLNSTWAVAKDNNMVVSFIPLSKETPLDKMHLIYQKILDNTFLPNKELPTIQPCLQNLTPGSETTQALLKFAKEELHSERLYYLLKCYVKTSDADILNAIKADFEGDFVSNADIKKYYAKTYNEKIKFEKNFAKTKDFLEYFKFMSYLFKLSGFKGWVILIDEVELIGRFAKNARYKSYYNMDSFLTPELNFAPVLTILALSESYDEDVIEKKNEWENLDTFALSFSKQDVQLYDKTLKTITKTLKTIESAPKLSPLTLSEVKDVLESIILHHAQSYDWDPQTSVDEIYDSIGKGNYLLRTRIRCAIEYLDNKYQYNEKETIDIKQLDNESFEETNFDIE